MKLIENYAQKSDVTYPAGTALTLKPRAAQPCRICWTSAVEKRENPKTMK